MKTLTNTTTEILKETGKEEKIDYKGLIDVCLNQAPLSGFSFEDMQQRGRIEKIIRKANGVMKFEDQDAANLKTIVKAAKWQFRHDDVIAFIEAVDTMKTAK